MGLNPGEAQIFFWPTLATAKLLHNCEGIHSHCHITMCVHIWTQLTDKTKKLCNVLQSCDKTLKGDCFHNNKLLICHYCNTSGTHPVLVCGLLQKWLVCRAWRKPCPLSLWLHKHWVSLVSSQHEVTESWMCIVLPFIFVQSQRTNLKKKSDKQR